MAFLTLSGDPFHVTADGPAGAPVIMLSNSLGTDFGLWDGQIAALTRHHRVLRYDSRGHGKSAAPDRPYSIEELGRDALAILDALAIDTVDWMGLSMGGMVGMWLLANAPQRIRRAVLANTSAYMGARDIWNERIRTVKTEGTSAIVDGVLGRWFTPEFRASGSPEIARIRAMLLATPPEGYAGCCHAIRDMDLREAFAAVDRPVLVIAGAKDPATTPSAAKAIQERIKGSALVTLDAAHLSNIEQPDAFNRAIGEFFA